MVYVRRRVNTYSVTAHRERLSVALCVFSAVHCVIQIELFALKTTNTSMRLSCHQVLNHQDTKTPGHKGYGGLHDVTRVNGLCGSNPMSQPSNQPKCSVAGCRSEKTFEPRMSGEILPQSLTLYYLLFSFVLLAFLSYQCKRSSPR